MSGQALMVDHLDWWALGILVALGMVLYALLSRQERKERGQDLDSLLWNPPPDEPLDGSPPDRGGRP